MSRLLQNRLFLQLLFTLIAAILVTTLSIVLISSAIQSAESVVVGEANQTISTALREMRQQYQSRAGSENSWSLLPLPARENYLRGITQSVLHADPGVEGGFFSNSHFLGYAFPTHDTGATKTDMPTAERGLILALVQQSLESQHALSQVVRGRRDLLVIGAVADKNHNTVAWAMKRLAEQAAPGLRAHNLLLSCLVLAALVSIAGTLATGLSLARGISQIKSGLASLEQDFDFHLPARSDELDGIIRSINRMAAVRRKLEAELRREDRLRAVGRLTAGIAHEIRNPLNSIALTIQVLERKAQTESIRREDLRTVRSEISRLNTLLGDLLNFQRARQPQPRVQSILPIVEHCISLVQKQAEIQTTQILLEPAHPGTCALCDSEQLTQTLVNLLLNAVESSPPGASVRVSIHQLSGRTFIDIDDKGPGLDAEQREHLFEPFYTTKATGSGLGLAVSRELMRNQGADLLYASTSAGTRFTVDLPGN